MYVEGFVIPVPTVNREDFRAFAKKIAAVFRKNGALRVVECWGDDVPEGELTSFPMAVKKQPDETVVFAWVEWPSRAERDAAHPKIMADPVFTPGKDPMPFDGKRMIFGGFETIVDV